MHSNLNRRSVAELEIEPEGGYDPEETEVDSDSEKLHPELAAEREALISQHESYADSGTLKAI
jgi:hypothetical protein